MHRMKALASLGIPEYILLVKSGQVDLNSHPLVILRFAGCWDSRFY